MCDMFHRKAVAIILSISVSYQHIEVSWKIIPQALSVLSSQTSIHCVRADSLWDQFVETEGDVIVKCSSKHQEWVGFDQCTFKCFYFYHLF